MLLRKFIGHRLGTYYSQSADAVVGSPPSIINFQNLWGEYHWKRTLDRMYKQGNNGHWFTPVELFKPHYSNVVANFIAKHSTHQPGDGDGKVDIVELGGGRATNAIAVLDHLQTSNPELYDTVHYTILDASTTLHKFQKNLLGSTKHANKVSFLHKDLMQVAEGKGFLPQSSRLTFVVAFEVLDNLPHDKIRARKIGSGKQQKRILEQCTVEEIPKTSATLTLYEKQKDHDKIWEERFVPLNDPLLKSILRLAPGYAHNPVTWVPTVALGLLHDLPKYRPNAQVLLADFDWFPSLPSSLPDLPPRRSAVAHGEPLIKAMDDNDYECYLSAPILSDILFPTDFHSIADFVKRSWRHSDRDIVVEKQSNFLLAYGEEEVAQTESWLTGYSPLIHDYSNTSVLAITNTASYNRSTSQTN